VPTVFGESSVKDVESFVEFAKGEFGPVMLGRGVPGRREVQRWNVLYIFVRIRRDRHVVVVVVFGFLSEVKM
jgi:hypothetical protein